MWAPAHWTGASYIPVATQKCKSRGLESKGQPRSMRPTVPALCTCHQRLGPTYLQGKGEWDSEVVELGSSKAGLGNRVCKGRARTWVAALLLCLAFSSQDVDVACAFTLFGGPAEEKDPVEPFTLYGSVRKKYLIEQIVDGKVVARKKGFTASVCVNALDASKETPEVAGLPAGLKVTLDGKPSCFKGVGPSRDESCRPPCQTACTAAVKQHGIEVKESTGYTFDPKDAAKATEACASQCFNECTKPGTSISFVGPVRPRR